MPVQIKEAVAKFAGAGGSDIFLHVQTKRAGKVKGEATATGHTDDIVLRSWRWALNGTAAIGSVQATGRRSYSGLNVIKQIDTATTGLMAALATNDEVKEAKLTMRKSGDGQMDYFVITLNGARISMVEHSVDTNGDGLESVTILFTKVEVEYRSQQTSGLRGGAYVFNDEILPA